MLESLKSCSENCGKMAQFASTITGSASWNYWVWMECFELMILQLMQLQLQFLTHPDFTFPVLWVLLLLSLVVFPQAFDSCFWFFYRTWLNRM